MNEKLNFKDSRLNIFRENIRDFNKEQGERLHEGINTLKTRY